MRKLFRILLMVMILVVVALMSALTAMRVAIHGRETTVPNFVKLSPSEAERVALGSGLQVSLEGQFYSADVPESKIVSQTPPPGARVRRGWRVRLAQSLGPQRVTIPDVVGQSRRAAELNVRQRGMDIATVAVAHLPQNLPTEQVVAQSPPASAQGVQSPKMNVLVAAQPAPVEYVMPNFVGRPLADAQAAIEQAGFKLQAVRTAQMPASLPPGKEAPQSNPIVTAQTPAFGQKITNETLIYLEVSH
jgi:eukaryotic-like serine/threonine-protein kinase